MYQVISTVNGLDHILMDVRDEEYILGTPKLTLQLNAAGVFTFTIHPTHPEIHSIIPLVSMIKIFKVSRDNTRKKWIFTGRVISNECDIYNTGKVKCEGILAYLLDSVVYPYEYQGTPADYVRQLIESHNAQVNDAKRFEIRTLDLSDVDSNNNIVRANRNYPTTFQELKTKVLKSFNAYISAEEADGTLYIDCSQSILHYNSQNICLGENIIDLKQVKSAGEIRTVMIGIGAENDDSSRLTVTVENDDAVAEYGRIVGTVEFEDVTTMLQLTKKTQAYLDGTIFTSNAVEIKAVDLNMADEEIEAIELGYCYVESPYNDLDHKRMLVSKMDIYLTQPEKNTFSLGAAIKSVTTGISHANADIDSRVKRIAGSISPKIQSAVENATQMITGAKGGYVILDCGENADKHPEQILIMDSPEKETSINVIRINKNGIGFSTSGYNGPYANAWTIDGNLVADFITAGTMFADRIRGGTLEIGGEKDGVITVLDAGGNTVATIDREGVNVLKGSIRGAEIIAGGTDNADGTITVLDEKGGTVVTIGKDGLTVVKGSISGTTIISSDGEKWIKISSGGITMGSGENTTGKINFSTGGLEFRGKELTFCMDKIKCGTSMDATNTKTAYTGDIKYAVKQEDDSIGNAVMNFRNGILMQNG